MATAYASHSSLAFESDGGTTTLDITKPTGLAAGDLMVAVRCVASTAGIATPSGWTNLTALSTDISSGVRFLIDFKIADAGDAAASSFDFGSLGTSGSGEMGAIFRFTGTSFTGAANLRVATATGLAGVDTSLVPFSTGSVMLLGAGVRGDVGTFDSYAIANNNPTWTERVDIGTSTAARDASLGIATATPSAASATGNSTITVNTAGSLPVSFLLVVQEDTNVTGTFSHLEVTPTIVAPTASVGVTGTFAHLSPTIALHKPTGVGSTPTKWTKVDKT